MKLVIHKLHDGGFTVSTAYDGGSPNAFACTTLREAFDYINRKMGPPPVDVPAGSPMPTCDDYAKPTWPDFPISNLR